MEISQPVWISLLGGAAVQILYVIDGLKAPRDRRPDFQSVSYYLSLLLNILVSGILGYVYFDEKQELNKIVYFHIGSSAPLILRTLATTLPEVVRGHSGENN